MKRTVYVVQGVLQMLIGVGAIASGALMVIAPDGRLMQMPVDMLKGSPFQNYLIPGIILLLIHGVGNTASAVFCFRRRRLAGFAGMFFGFALVIWLFVQVSMIGGGHWLQTLYFALGVTLIAFGIALRELERR